MHRSMRHCILILMAGICCFACQQNEAKIRTSGPEVIAFRVIPFALSDIKLLDGPFLRATELNIQSLLNYEPDRFLARFREDVGLQPRAEQYYGWEADPELADYYERALLNHFYASQHPEDGRVIYNLNIDMGGQKHFQNPYGFTCCVGTGMESHSKYGGSIDVLVDDHKLETINGSSMKDGHFLTLSYPIPPDVTHGKTHGNEVSPVV